jgi:hypothetical protein
MTDDQLSRADKIRIRRAVQSARDWQAANPEAPDVLDMGRQLANMLRVDMPDVDSVSIGRVCLYLAEFIDDVIDAGQPCPAVMAVGNQVKTAGFDLTSIEWEESP